MTYACPNCGPSGVTSAQQIMGKISLAAVGVTLGAHATKNPIAILICAGLGMWIGHQIDLRCPQCGGVLQLVQLLS